MAEFPALPLWTDAYIADTQHLTNEEHGVYLRLLMFAWRSPDCSIPDDDKRLSIMVGVSPKIWAKLKPVILAFWTLDGKVYRQKKLTAGRQKVSIMVEQKRQAGLRSVEAKSLKSKERASTGVATESQHPFNARSTNQNQNQEKENNIKEKDNLNAGFRAFWLAMNDNRYNDKRALQVWRELELHKLSDDVQFGASVYVKSRSHDQQYWKAPANWLKERQWEQHLSSKQKPFDRQYWHQAVKRYHDFIQNKPEYKGSPPAHIWSDKIGPNPSHKNCRADPSVLIEFGYRAKQHA